MIDMYNLPRPPKRPERVLDPMDAHKHVTLRVGDPAGPVHGAVRPPQPQNPVPATAAAVAVRDAVEARRRRSRG